MATFEFTGKDGQIFEVDAEDIQSAQKAIEHYYSTNNINKSKTPRSSGMMGFIKNLADSPQARTIAQGVPVLGASVPDNEETFKFKQENPKTATALHMGGNVAAMIPAALATGGMSLPAGLAADAGISGIVSAADAYARDQDPQKAGILGALLGPMGRLIGRGVSPGIKPKSTTMEAPIIPEMSDYVPNPFPSSLHIVERGTMGSAPGSPAEIQKLIMGTAARKQDEALKAALGVKGTPKEGAEAAMAAAQGRPLPTKTVDIPVMTGDSAIGGLVGGGLGYLTGHMDPIHAAMLGALAPHALKRAGTYGNMAMNSDTGKQFIGNRVFRDNSILDALLRSSTLGNTSFGD
jgi:hypothetical protein